MSASADASARSATRRPGGARFPTAWPRLSLIALNRSRSRNNTATCLPVRRAAPSATSRRSRNRTRWGSPVRGSCCAWYSGGGTFVHLEHEVHRDEEGQDARSGQNRGQLRRVARGALHREQRRREQRQPNVAASRPVPKRGGRTNAWSTARRSDGVSATAAPRHTQASLRSSNRPTGMWSTPSERERKHRIDDEQARQRAGDGDEAVGLGTRESGQAQCKPDQHRVGERYEQCQRVCERRTVVHQERAPGHQRQCGHAHQCFEDRTERPTREQEVHADRQARSDEERTGERGECRRRRHRSGARSVGDAEEAPGREDRESSSSSTQIGAALGATSDRSRGRGRPRPPGGRRPRRGRARRSGAPPTAATESTVDAASARNTTLRRLPPTKSETTEFDPRAKRTTTFCDA